jgi:hypothetical protein
MAAEVVEQAEQEHEEAPDFSDVRLDRRFVINRDGKDFVLMAGLVDMLHQLSDGFFEVNTTLIQIPGKENNDTAIVTARVVVFDQQAPDSFKRVATGIGDASPANVNRMMQPHLIRMAETRATARALRLLTNVGMATLEELGPQGADDATERTPPSTEKPYTPRGAGGERIMVEGKPYDRPQVVAAYKRRLAEAQGAGLAIPPGDILADDAPLSVLVGASQAFRRRLEARDGTGK